MSRHVSTRATAGAASCTSQVFVSAERMIGIHMFHITLSQGVMGRSAWDAADDVKAAIAFGRRTRHGNAMVPLSFGGVAFRALANGALYWPERQALLLADLHLEKGSWFAARGFCCCALRIWFVIPVIVWIWWPYSCAIT